MNKVEIKARLEESYQQYLNYLGKLSKDEYEYAPEGKWNAGEQTVHLIKSVKPVANGLGMPKFLLKYKFGKANRPSRSYDELIERYRTKLEKPYAAPDAYSPSKVKHAQANELDKKLKKYIDLLEEKLVKWTEEQLDEYVVPHPLLGKITIRELFYFTIYHAHHHQLLIKQYLKA